MFCGYELFESYFPKLSNHLNFKMTARYIEESCGACAQLREDSSRLLKGRRNLLFANDLCLTVSKRGALALSNNCKLKFINLV
ncbi:hypothetical protein M514_09732 [Trichuris suis]|uniref:Uncharacterized protein n=1 Tax=Trichuris suis TaxID=68888 RepID=A0A085N518_9BILA|nr:hypothetical protein M513_09732 [Trichuris suis]KFD64564.1 hypothetical protein M514_09732 [Trichuris suis]